MAKTPSDEEVRALIDEYLELTNKAAMLDGSGSYASLVVDDIPNLTVWARDPFHQLQLFVREELENTVLRRRARKAALKRLLAGKHQSDRPARRGAPAPLPRDRPFQYGRHVPSQAACGAQVRVLIHPDLTVDVRSPSGDPIGRATWRRNGVTWSDEDSQALPGTARTMIASDIESLTDLFVAGLLDVRDWTTARAACLELRRGKQRRKRSRRIR